MRILALSVTAVMLAGCQTVGPTWSELSGARYYHTAIDRRAVIVSRVDEQSTPIRLPIKIEPGAHVIELESLRHGSDRGGVMRTLQLDVEPCKRYYINAQFATALAHDYRPVIDEVEDIAGCKVR